MVAEKKVDWTAGHLEPGSSGVEDSGQQGRSREDSSAVLCVFSSDHSALVGRIPAGRVQGQGT